MDDYFILVAQVTSRSEECCSFPYSPSCDPRFLEGQCCSMLHHPHRISIDATHLGKGLLAYTHDCSQCNVYTQSSTHVPHRDNRGPRCQICGSHEFTILPVPIPPSRYHLDYTSKGSSQVSATGSTSENPVLHCALCVLMLLYRHGQVIWETMCLSWVGVRGPGKMQQRPWPARQPIR